MYHTRLASIGTNTLNCVTKCGFPLTEEQKKQKTFFSHTAGSMGLSVQGVFRSHSILELLFLLPSAIAWPAPPTRPPCVFWVVGFQVVP